MSKPKLTCTEARTKLAEITHLKDAFLRVFQLLINELSSHERKKFFTRATVLKEQLRNEMNEFFLEFDIYPVTIDYTLSLEQMIEQGNYNKVGEVITSTNFRVEGNGTVSLDLELVSFDRELTTTEILGEFESRGLAPAKIEHLLAFGAKYPEKQRKLIIIALGASGVHANDGDHYVLDLYGRTALRALGYCNDNDDRQWHTDFQFLAVKKNI